MSAIPFDQYQRYNHASEIISKWKMLNGADKVTILEVGANEHKNLEVFLTGDAITYLDIYVPENLKSDSSYIEGDATNMSFSEGQFDWIVALDVYEHIPNERKDMFIRELNRVSKHGFIISAPFNTAGVSSAERNMSTLYKSLYREDYRWLKEHEELGLPDLDDTILTFKQLDAPFIHFGHGSLNIWSKMTSAHFLAAGFFDLFPYRSLMDELYNEKMYEYDYSGNCYRQFFVSITNSAILNQIENLIEERNANSIESSSMEQLENYFRELRLLRQEAIIRESEMRINSQVSETYLKFNTELVRMHEQMEFMRVNKEQIIAELKQQHLNECNELQILVNENQLKIQTTMQTLEENKIEMMKKTEEISEVNKKIMEAHAIITEKDRYINELEIISESLRLKNRVKRIIPKSIKKPVKKLLRLAKLVKNNPQYIKRGISELRNRGVKGLVEKIDGAALTHSQPEYMPEDINNLELNKLEMENWTIVPLISVLMPVYNVQPKWLDLAIKSVTGQIYPNWELCIVDDCSTNPETTAFLKKISHPQIKIKFLSENKGISGATNEAASQATGDYLGLLDNDDELREVALFEMVKAMQSAEYDLLYSDEDKIDINGLRKTPLYKPDWSPDLLRSQMYVGHFLVFKRDLFNKVGGYRIGFEGAQDYDLVLRMTEVQDCRIHHVPKVLYSWRELETSTALNPDSKPYAHTAGLKAVDEHMKRVFGEGQAWAQETGRLFVYDARYKLPKPEPKVSIIIPTKDKIELLDPCIKSIVDCADYPNYEVLIMNNNSELHETYEWFGHISKKYDHIKIIDAHYPFNWSKLNNHGIREATGDVYIFMNNDTVVITPDWLTRFAEKAIQENTGTVGALLLFEDETIQHAGVVIGFGGWADHVFKGLKPVHYGSPYISPMVTRNVSSSTGACLAISKNTINKIGDFDEDFIICGSDVEISLRAYQSGLFNIYDPDIRLYHFESKTRTSHVPDQDFKMSYLHYKPYLESGDPFYNKNLSLQHVIPTTINREGME